MNRNSVLNVTVQTGGTHVVAHAGLHALGAFADRIGLGAALSQAIAWSGERAPTHDRGVVLTHTMLMLAAGGEACSDIEFLSSQPRLFGAVASDSTLYRTVRNIGPTVLADLNTQTAIVRAGMWRRMGATSGTSMVVGYRRVVDRGPSGEQARNRPDLQGRVRVSPVAVFGRCHG
jgi:hypothetical protein